MYNLFGISFPVLLQLFNLFHCSSDAAFLPSTALKFGESATDVKARTKLRTLKLSLVKVTDSVPAFWSSVL